MLACRAGDAGEEAVRVLLAAKADPSLPSRSGCTALAVAAEEGAAGAVELLLAAGALPDMPDDNGRAPAG